MNNYNNNIKEIILDQNYIQSYDDSDEEEFIIEKTGGELEDEENENIDVSNNNEDQFNVGESSENEDSNENIENAFQNTKEAEDGDSNDNENINNNNEVASNEEVEERNSKSNIEENVEGYNKENNVKTIIFSNNNNSNLENIIFNNENANNLSNFLDKNHNIVIEEEVAIKEEDLIYKDDIVYLQELTNQLLSEYPVTKQGLKYIAEDVEKVAQKLLDVKNDGVKKYNLLEKGIEYPFINDIINDKFNNSYIFPIVLDKHRIYSKIKSDQEAQIEDENQDKDLYLFESRENTKGIIEDNQKAQLAQLKVLSRERALNNIDYKDYLNKVNEIIQPYITKYENNNIGNVGYIKNPKNNILVMRYNDLNTIHWNTHNISSNLLTYKDIFNEQGKITGIEESVLVNGNDINIVGFFILGKGDNLHKNLKMNGVITSIKNLKDHIIIECKDHGLNPEEDTIYIQDSNSFPKIDNKYINSIKIISKDKIEITKDIKLVKDGTNGILYSIPKLKFNLYTISFENDTLKISLKENRLTENKVYLFDNLSLTKKKYDDIIKQVLPTIDEIMNIKLNELKNVYTFDDVNDIIKDYQININDLDVDQITIIKNIFKTNLDKLEAGYEEEKDEVGKKNNKRYFNNDFNNFLNDKYITDERIEMIYGKYPHLNKRYDNLMLRLKWVENQKDNGKIYYLNYLLYQKNDFDKKYIQNKIDQLTGLLKSLEKNFKDDKNKKTRAYKYQAHIVSESDASDDFKNLKKTLLEDTVVFYKDNLYLWKGKLVKFTDVEEGTIALVGDKLWVWEKDAWRKSDAIPKYNNIRSLCELNNIDLLELKLDTLDCIYRKDLGCDSKIYIRLKENILKTKEALTDFDQLSSYIKDNSENREILQDIDFIIKKNYGYISNKLNKSNKLTKLNKLSKKNKLNENSSNSSSSNNSEINNTMMIENKSKEEVFKDNLSVVLKLINSIDNYYKRLDYIYTLIDQDGIMIDDAIYSKKYGRKMDLCGHYYYFKKINYAHSPEDKTLFIDQLVNKFGDSGESEKDIQVCKHCGEFLEKNNYDESEGFSESGMIKMSREIWKVEIEEKIDLINYIKESNLEDKSFKELLLQYGLSMENIEEAIYTATFITKNLFSKAGIKLPTGSLINIIIDSMQKIKRLPPYFIFKSGKIKQYQDKGFSKMNIDKLDEKNVFKNEYDRYIAIKKSSIISARFLIEVQCAIPNAMRSSKFTICPFYSFDGDEGITYMACILDEMKVVILKDKTKAMEILKTGVKESYDDFKSLVHIRKLFDDKKVFEEELSKKTKDYLFTNEEHLEDLSQLVEPVEISDEFELLLKESKDIDTVYKLKNILINRLKFLGKSIKRTVADVIANSAPSDPYSEIQTSCCTEDAIQFLNYYFYIETESSYPVKKNIDQSVFIYPYTKYFINFGAIHKFFQYDKYKFDGIYNEIIVDNEVDTPESIIKAVFEVFVSEGFYAGTMREYVGKIDIKSGLTREEILSKNYTIKEYQELLRNIEKHNIKYYKVDNKVVISSDILDTLKKDSVNLLDKKINDFVKNIATILSKDNKFIDKYVKLLRNCGIFELNISNDIDVNQKNKIKERELLNKNKLNYIKKFYISKLKKYLSTIKNATDKSLDNIKISFEEDETIAKEIQSSIYTQNSKLLPFLKEDVRIYFTNLILDYTNEEINSINGIDNIYDSKYEKIKVYSDFNFNDASNVLLYILIKQLDDFILCSYQEDKDINTNSTINIKCKYVSMFILILLEELEEDNQLFNECRSEVEGIKNSMIHDAIEYKTKMFYKEDSDDKMAYIAKDDEVYTEYEDNDTLEDIKEIGKRVLTERLGYEPSKEELDEFADNYLQDQLNNEDIDENDLDHTAKGIEVIDQGAGYGEFSEFDFEDGDGFDYSQEMTE